MPVSSEKSLQVVLAPALPAEKWTSIDLYYQDLKAALAEFNEKLIQFDALPSRESDVSWLTRQRLFYVTYPRELRKHLNALENRPVTHILDHSYSYLCRFATPTIVTCHDVANLRVSDGNLHQRLLYKFRINGMRKASRISCISQNTARDVSELLEIDTSKLIVNYYGVDQGFRPRPRITAITRIAALHPSIASAGFKILHVGSNIRRKNIPTLLKAFAQIHLRLPNAKLLKVGDDLYKDGFGPLIEKLGVGGAIIQLGKLNSEALIDVYSACDALAFPSLYEGFGRPIIEAMGCGLPCVVALASSLPEVGGDAVLYHKAQDSQEMAARILAIATDENLRQHLVRSGMEQASHFTWHRHAQALIDLYRELQ